MNQSSGLAAELQVVRRREDSMNWEAIGAIAESLGAIGVIASLVYLASQIRDTRRALRGPDRSR